MEVWLVFTAVIEWKTLMNDGASDIARQMSQELGFASAAEELRAFLHSPFAQTVLDVCDIDCDAAYEALGLGKPGKGCTCPSCCGTGRQAWYYGGDVLTSVISAARG